MCDDPDDPRCSSHARDNLINAVLEYEAADSRREFAAASARLRDAERAWFATPDGISENDAVEADDRVEEWIRRRAATQAHNGREILRARMEEVVSVRLNNKRRAMEAGFPRPVAAWLPRPEVVARLVVGPTGPQSLPIPWALTTQDGTLTQKGWKSFEGHKAIEAHLERLCQVCGEQVDGRIYHLIVATGERSAGGFPVTSGPGMHARCAVMTLKFCPHFRKEQRLAVEAEDGRIAWGWDGKGQGYIAEDTIPDEDCAHCRTESTDHASHPMALLKAADMKAIVALDGSQKLSVSGALLVCRPGSVMLDRAALLREMSQT